MADTLFNTGALLAVAGIVLALLRLLKGPATVDRVVALDAMTVISISLIVFIGKMAGRVIYLDVALIYGLISFVGVVALARYLERGL